MMMIAILLQTDSEEQTLQVLYDGRPWQGHTKTYDHIGWTKVLKSLHHPKQHTSAK